MESAINRTRMEKLIRKITTFNLSDKGKRNLVVVITQLFFVLFLYAAASKFMDYQKFTVQVGQSPILTNYADTIAWMIPAIEILICMMLVIPRTKMIGLYASFSLMVLFTVYIVVIMNFAERVPCSCGGILSKMGWTEHLVFNSVFVVLSIIGIVFQSNLEQKKGPKVPH